MFYFVRKAGQRELEVRGPAVSRAYQKAGYAVWLPEEAAGDARRYVEAIATWVIRNEACNISILRFTEAGQN